MSIKKVSASQETLAAASAKAAELAAEKKRSKPASTGIGAAAGNLLGVGALGAAYGGALEAPKGQRGQSALRAGAGSLLGGLAGSVADRKHPVRGYVLGSTAGAGLAARSVRKRPSDGTEEAKTAQLSARMAAALFQGYIEGVDKHAGKLGDIINKRHGLENATAAAAGKPSINTPKTRAFDRRLQAGSIRTRRGLGYSNKDITHAAKWSQGNRLRFATDNLANTRAAHPVRTALSRVGKFLKRVR